MDPLLYTSDCRQCSYLMIAPTPAAVSCPRCNSADHCTPPTPIFVVPRRPYHGRREDELEEVLNRSFEEQMDPSPDPATDETLRAMQRGRLTVRSEHGGTARECGICFEVLEPGTEAILTPCCSHYVHLECMEKTLVVTPRCPFCRSPRLSISFI